MTARTQASAKHSPPVPTGLIAGVKDAIASAVEEAIKKHMPPARDELLTKQDVSRITGLGYTSLYEDETLRRALIKIGRSSRWPASSVYAWVETKKAEGQQ